MHDQNNAIEASGLAKNYGGKVQALDGLSLSVPAGTVFGLLGPNGAGKSTTVKILTTLTRPDAGTATVGGLDVLAEPAAVRRVIGSVSQRPQFDPMATGFENLLLQGRLYGIRGGRVRDRAGELLERFGLADARDRQARTYSGGMQRKLDVALGLVHRPQVLFLDEPTTGLDPAARSQMWTEISALSGDEGLTVLLTTHYLEEADRLAARIAIVDRGSIVTAGTPEELKAELNGDTVVLELVDPADADSAVSVLHRLGAARPTVQQATVRARVALGARAVPGLLAGLEDAGVGVDSVSVSRPSLDDVYLRHTGRAFAAADGAPDIDTVQAQDPSTVVAS